MPQTWMSELVVEWDVGSEWSKEDVEHLSASLESICERNNGTVLLDEDLPDGAVAEYEIRQTRAVLDGFAASIARRLTRHPIPLCSASSKDFSTHLPFLTAAKHVPRVNLNTASVAELDELPGLGPKTAQRVSDFRKTNGRIKRLSELQAVKGISEKEIRKFAPRAYLSEAPASIAAASERGVQFIASPNFSHYVDFLREGSVLGVRFSRDPKDLKDLVMQEVVGIARDLEMRPRPHGLSPGIRASQLRRDLEEKAALDGHVEQHSINPNYGSLLTDSSYYYFTNQLLRTAQNSIRIIMFYFVFRDKGDHPSDEFMEEIVRAHNRGVDVRVILDHQDEDDPRQSSAINDDAFVFLRNNEVPVVFDSDDQVTHTKLVLVDDSHVVIGSHNWTAGSFFVYRDTSVYVKSEELGRFYSSQFNNLWSDYGG